MATIIGTTQNNELFGGSGADFIEGLEGDDTLYGGGGIAVPNDTADSLYGGSGNDLIYGNGGNDFIRGGEMSGANSTGTDTIYGGLGIDTIYGGDNADFLAGGGGIAHPVDDADLILGDGGDDFIVGNGGNDTIVGGTSAGETNSNDDDVIYGGLGNDLIYGAGGLDAILGQNGNDTLAGGTDSDLFFIGSDHGNDIVLDFEDPDTALSAEYITDDYLVIEKNINGTGIDTFAELMANASVSGGNLVINLGSGNSVTLNGVTTLGTSDVQFYDAGDRFVAYDTIYGGYGVGDEENFQAITPTGDNQSSTGVSSYNTIYAQYSGAGRSIIYDFDTDGSTGGLPDKLAIEANINGSGIDTVDELIAHATYMGNIQPTPGGRATSERPGYQIDLSGNGNTLLLEIAEVSDLTQINIEFFSLHDFVS